MKKVLEINQIIVLVSSKIIKNYKMQPADPILGF